MAKKRGNIRVQLTVSEGVGHVRAVHTGIKGNRTLGRMSWDLTDKAAFRKEAARFLAGTHPKMHAPMEAS